MSEPLQYVAIVSIEDNIVSTDQYVYLVDLLRHTEWQVIMGITKREILLLKEMEN